MKIELSKEAQELLETGTCINGKYYYLPYWFEKIGNNIFTVYSFEKLPNEIKSIIINHRLPGINKIKTNEENKTG